MVHRRNSKRPRTSQAFSCAGLKQPLQMPSNKMVDLGQLVGNVRESLKGLSNRRSAENGPLSSMPEWEAHPTCSQFNRDSFAMSEPFCNHHAPKFRCQVQICQLRTPGWRRTGRRASICRDQCGSILEADLVRGSNQNLWRRKGT